MSVQEAPSTVLITGCSSGFGLAAAQMFLDRGWRVIATMRRPQEDLLPPSDRLRILALDVSDSESIQKAVEEAGPIDVLVNNAGIGLANGFEATPMATVRELFETNTFGTMEMAQAYIPQFRERKAGVIINVTSSVTLKAYPLLSAYTATKGAINAFSESLAAELKPFGIRVCVVLPGMAPETKFGANARSRMTGGFHAAYEEMGRAFIQSAQRPTEFTTCADVTEAIWRAATDPDCPVKLPAGADAIAAAGAKRD